METCLRCGLSPATEQQGSCSACARELAGLNGYQLNQRPRHCPICSEKMYTRRDKTKDVLYWLCPACHARFYVPTASLWVRGIKANGSSVAEKNRFVCDVAWKARRAAAAEVEAEKVLGRVVGAGDVVAGLSTSELRVLVLDHGSEAVRERAFETLAAMTLRPSVRRNLELVAKSDSPCALRARGILDGAVEGP